MAPSFSGGLEKNSNESNSVLEQCNKVYFFVNKTDHPFSSMSIDQAHEQNIKVVKVDGGAIDILENESFFLKWVVSGPVRNDLLNKTNQDFPNSQKSRKNHEDTSTNSLETFPR